MTACSSNCVVPGITLTESVHENAAAAAERLGTTVEDVMDRMLKKQNVDVGRFAQPEEIANRDRVPRVRESRVGSPAPPSPSTAAPSTTRSYHEWVLQPSSSGERSIRGG